MKRSRLSNLVEGTLRLSGSNKHELVEKMGYKNTNKGLRRLDAALSQGKCTDEFLKQCAVALSLDPENILAVARTDDEERRAKRALMQKENFRPYVYVMTYQGRPSSIAMFALTGGVRKHKSFYVPEEVVALESSEQYERVSQMVRAHYNDSNGLIPFFGDIKGYLYCPTYEESYEFSIEGKVVSDNMGTFQLPVATLRVT